MFQSKKKKRKKNCAVLMYDRLFEFYYEERNIKSMSHLHL